MDTKSFGLLDIVMEGGQSVPFQSKTQLQSYVMFVVVFFYIPRIRTGT